MIEIQLPTSVPSIRALHVGERVSISGTIYTVRRSVLEHMRDGGELPIEPGCIAYHTGPVGTKRGKKYTVQSLAPDHTAPLDPFIRELLVRHSVRALIGRGELGKQTLEACRQYGASYFQTVGGAGPLLAKKVEQVTAVHMSDKFDPRDSMWEIVVKDFPAIVMIDSNGQSLFDIVRDASQRRLINLQI